VVICAGASSVTRISNLGIRAPKFFFLLKRNDGLGYQVVVFLGLRQGKTLPLPSNARRGPTNHRMLHPSNHDEVAFKATNKEKMMRPPSNHLNFLL
jgi:hypothetical protein